MKKFITLLITLLTALLLLSCNANKVEENIPQQPQPKEKIKCYIYQGKCMNNVFNLFKSEPILSDNGKTIEYWKGDCGFVEKEVGNDYYYLRYEYTNPYNMGMHFLVEVDPNDYEWENGPITKEIQKYLTTENLMESRPGHWGNPVKIGETEDRIFYAVALLGEKVDFDVRRIANETYEPAETKIKNATGYDWCEYTGGHFFVYNGNYKSCKYVKTLDNGTEIYEAYWQVGDELVYKNITPEIIIYHPELDKTFTFHEMAYPNAWNMENSNFKDNLYVTHHWTYQGDFMESCQHDTDIPAKEMPGWQNIWYEPAT